MAVSVIALICTLVTVASTQQLENGSIVSAVFPRETRSEDVRVQLPQLQQRQMQQEQQKDAALPHQNVFQSMAHQPAAAAAGRSSQRALGTSETSNGISRMVSLRTSVTAADMNYPCWENTLAYYAGIASRQCSYDGSSSPDVDAVWDSVHYPEAKVMVQLSASQSTSGMTVAELVQSNYNAGSSSLSYKVVMKNDLRAMGCDRVLCTYFLNSDGYTYQDVYVLYCFYIYKTTFSTTVSGLPYTPGTPCSLCGVSDACVSNLCKGSYADLPGATNCHSTTTTTTTTTPRPGCSAAGYTEPGVVLTVSMLSSMFFIFASRRWE